MKCPNCGFHDSPNEVSYVVVGTKDYKKSAQLVYAMLYQCEACKTTWVSKLDSPV